MNISYKYLLVSDGIIVLFENEIPDLDKGVSFGFKVINGIHYVSIGTNNFIPIETQFLNMLEESERIYIVISEKDELSSYSQGIIHIDKIMVGKLLAYSEMSV